MQMTMEQDAQTQTIQRKVAGFDKAILTYRKLVKESNNGVSILSKRKAEFISYVQRVVFKYGDDTIVTPPELHIQEMVVSRMRDM
jgi:hypothetical protein